MTQIAASTVKKSFTLLVLCAVVLAAFLPFVSAFPTSITVNAYDNTAGAAVTGVPVPIWTSSGAWLANNVSIVTPYVYNVDTANVPFTVYANATDSYGNNLKGYTVNGVLNLGTSYTVTASTPNLAAGFTITAVYEYQASPTPGQGTGNYTLYGLNNENSGNQAYNGTTVTAYYTNRTPEALFVNGTYGYNTSYVPQRFSYDLGNSITREYWVMPTETNATLYVTNETTTTYTINFMDQVGLLKTSPYISAKTYINGSLVTIDRQKADSTNTIIMNLIAGKEYDFVFDGVGQTSYDYGNVLMTSSTSVQLILRGVDFPKASLLLYQYVHAYAVRDFLNPIGAITVSYQDINNQTNSVVIDIKYSNGSSAVSQSFPSNQTFSYTWNTAVNATDYQVIITVDHATYGTFYFKQYLIGEYTKPTSPFSLDALGTIPGIETAWFLPALLIIFVAACFSELTSEVACVLTAVMAVFLAVIGWIPITTSALVIALSFAIMAGVVTVRRRFF